MGQGAGVGPGCTEALSSQGVLQHLMGLHLEDTNSEIND